jgi:hypothetical protein
MYAQEVVPDTFLQPDSTVTLVDSPTEDDSLRIADSIRVADSLRLQEAIRVATRVEDSIRAVEAERAAYRLSEARMLQQARTTLRTAWSEWQDTATVTPVEAPKSTSARQRAARLDAQRRTETATRIDSIAQAATRQAALPTDASEVLMDFRLPIIASNRPPVTDLSACSVPAASHLRQAATLQATDDADPAAAWQRATDLNRERQLAVDHFLPAHPYQVHYLRGCMLQAPEKEMMSKDHLLRGSQVDVAGFNMNIQPLQGGKPSADKWHYHGYSTYQMTQTAMSDNWYKGGEDNMTIYSDQKLQIKRYDADKITTFETTIQLKLGFYYTQADTIHSMRVNDNQLSLDVKYGYRAWKRWYYSTSMTFKTPIFNFYAANSRTMKSALLSPAELNLNLGTDYSYENKKKTVSYSLMLAPLSYYMKYVNNKHVSVTQYGIDANHRVLNQIGSSLTSKLSWKINNNIQWESRLYMFTSYDSFLGEFENTFTFKVNRYLSANIMLYPRIDDGTAYDPWQMKEMLTFGFNYVWK